MSLAINKTGQNCGGKAIDIAKNTLFTDSVGDLYFRLDDGAIHIGDEELTAYSEDDLEKVDHDSFDYLQKCQVVAGSLEVNVIR